MLYPYQRSISLACLIFLSVFISFPVAAHAEVVYFCWQPNQESNLAGYRIYYGTAPGSYDSVTDVGNPPVQADGFVHGQVENLTAGTTYYFAATAYSVEGFESDFTEELTWHSANLPPIAIDSSVSGDEDTSIIGTLAVDNIDGLPTQFIIETHPLAGTLTVDEATRQFIYVPFMDFNGQDSFTFIATNANGSSNAATVSIDIRPVNDAPLVQDAMITTSEDSSITGQLVGSDKEEDILTFALVGQAENGSVIVDSNGAFTYVPDENWSGSDTFTFSAHDGVISSNTATITINVATVNDPPVANSQSISVAAGATVSGFLTAVDVEGDTLGYEVNSSPSQGMVFVNSDGSFSYTANQDASGNDSFSFTANDNTSSSQPATVAITITESNQELSFELVEIQVDSYWQHLDFAKSFTHPVVVAKAVSFNDSETGVVRVRNVTGSGLELRYQEWDSLDGNHASEMITLIVAEAGSFVLENGAQVEAGCFQAASSGAFSSVTFQQGMTTAPVVVAAVNSVNEEDAVTLRLQNINENGFEFMMQEQEANSPFHAEESVCYMAWEPSMGSIGTIQYEVVRTPEQVGDKDVLIDYGSRFVETPLVMVNQQTANDMDTAVLRVRENSLQSLSMFISEEQSVDLEKNHLAGAGGYLAFAVNDPTADPDNDGLTTEDEDFIYTTHPGIGDTDQDGILDGAEVDLWQSLGSLWSGDIDQDGAINLLDLDADGDGMSDGEEVAMGYDPGNPHDLDVSEIILGGEAYKIKGDKYAELTWSGANSGNADIYRNGSLLFTVPNNGTFTHGPFSSGKPAAYKVCEPGSTNCSKEVTLSWK